MKYARECSVTGEGMNAGWVFGDGVFYAKYEKDALAECRRDRDAILQDIEDVDISMIQDQFCEEDAGWKLFNDAVRWFKSREKQFGVGNVDRSNMAQSRFYDYLANYGGPESAGGSWLQQRMIDSAYGRVDNEPHIPKDKRMYEEGEWTADKSPSLRTIRKNIAEQYMNIMNNTSNPDFVGGYSDSSNFINKRDAMKLARTLAQTKSLTRYPDPI